MKRLILTTTCLCVLFVAGTALADWKEGDPYKMHYPQLPDPYGWDVSFSNDVLADDWQCSESGPVEDIHFWVSFKDSFEPSENFVGPTLSVGILSNIPAGEVGNNYSLPGELLWERTFTDGQYEGEFAGYGEQGWLDPLTGYAVPNDHTAYYLVNIDPIERPFWQEKGNIYWLEIQALLPENADYEIGWKTSISEHFMDDAVWRAPDVGWQELLDPSTEESLDLAFVITPEPATVALLGLGSLSLLRRKR